MIVSNALGRQPEHCGDPRAHSAGVGVNYAIWRGAYYYRTMNLKWPGMLCPSISQIDRDHCKQDTHRRPVNGEAKPALGSFLTRTIQFHTLAVIGWLSSVLRLRVDVVHAGSSPLLWTRADAGSV